MTQMIAAVVIATNLVVATPVPTLEEIDPVPSRPYLGTFEVTAYSYHEGEGENYQTASGATPKPYVTVAVDPEIIPLGTVLYIEGIGEVVAEDTGGAVKGNVIDLHVGYDNPEPWGRKELEVYKN